MPRLLLTLVVLACIVPARADEASELVAQLFDGDANGVFEARAKLLVLGPSARVALERRVDPASASEVGAAPSPEERSEIAALIERLDSAQYVVREQATADLVGKGLPAIPALRAALADPSLERKTRAQRIIDAILPPATAAAGPLSAFHLVQATLLLGWIGDASSVPRLRRVLETGTPTVASAADFALRQILGGGPVVTPLAWRSDPAAARVAWAAFLAAPALNVEGELVLVPPVTGVARDLTATSRQEFRFTGAEVGMREEELHFLLESTERFASTLRAGTPFADERRYETHRVRYDKHGQVGDVELGERAFALVLGEGGPLSIDPPQDQREIVLKAGMLTPGMLLRSALPTGTMRWEPTEIASASARRLARLLALAVQPGQPLDDPRVGQGRARYLGRRDGIDRVHVGLEWGFVPKRIGRACAFAVSGVLDLDARDGVLLAYDLSGPVWLVAPMRGQAAAVAVVVGEQRFEVTIGERERFTAGVPELDAHLTALADSDPARRVAAARALRAAGEVVRPVLEGILRPGVDATADADVLATRIAAVLAAKDELERQRAFVALLHLGRRAVRAALLARLEASSGEEARALIELVRRASPPEHLAVEAALLLAAIGTDASVAPLRAGLVTGTSSGAAACDFALRAIAGEGPPLAASPLAHDRAPLVAAWDALLAARAAGTGPATTLVPRAAPELELSSSLRCRMDVRVGGRGAPGIDMGDVVVVSTVEGRFRRLAGDRLRIAGRLVRYRDDVSTAKGRPAALAIDDQEIELAETAPSVLAMSLGATPLKGSTPAILPLALCWAELLPGGEYAVGAARPVSAELVERLRGSLAIPPSMSGRLSDHAGRLTYLGRRDGRDRYALALQLVVEVEREKILDRGALAGVVEVDPVRGHVAKVSLSGPGWGRVGEAPTVGWTEIAEDCSPTPSR